MGWFRTVWARTRAGFIVGFTVLVAFTALSVGNDGVIPLVFILQLSCFFAAMWMLYAEWDEVRAQLWIAAKGLSERELSLPTRWERPTGSWLGTFLILGTALLGVLLCLDAPRTAASRDAAAGRALLFTAFWAVPLYLQATLCLAGLSLLRYRLAIRAILPDVRPVLSAAAPWTVAAMTAPLLLFAAVGTPGPATVRLMGDLATLAIRSYGSGGGQTSGGPEQGADGGGQLLLTAAEPSTELLVELGDDDSIDELALPLLLFGAEREPAFPNITLSESGDLAQTWLVRVPSGRAEALASLLARDRENVDHIELNSALVVEGAGRSSACQPAKRVSWDADPMAPYQPEIVNFWGLAALRLLESKGVIHAVLVAVIDTGIDGGHEDLAGVVEPAGREDDNHGHGTRVAGLIGAVGANRRGIVTKNMGGRFIRLRSYAAMASRNPTARDIVTAIDRAMDDGARIINMSFGEDREAPQTILQAAAMAERRGVLLVASAGNRERGHTEASEQWPANVPGVLVVAALGRNGLPLATSRGVSGIPAAAWAPGEQLCTTELDGGYTAVTGTSFAAPLVSGAAAAMLAQNPGLSPAELRRTLVGTPRL